MTDEQNVKASTEEENEFGVLVGAKVTGVRQLPDDGETMLAIDFLLPPTLALNGGRRLTYEVWRDEEGNGPGYLALTKVQP